jgi:hypothetical protein
VKTRGFVLSIGLLGGTTVAASAQNLLSNGNLDVMYQQEIVAGFFLPKPNQWVNVGSRSISGPFEDEMSSEPWAGPAPTPVTTDGFNVDTGADTNDDWGVFFKPFSGGATNGLATGHLYQDVAGTPGMTYTLTGWAGAESNAMMTGAEFAIEFLDAGLNIIGSSVQSLLPTLFVDNGLAFDYKMYTLNGVAPAGTVWVRSRASMIGAQSNPAGGGQAYVVDDFTLTVVPEPTTMAVLGLGALALLRRRAKR